MGIPNPNDVNPIVADPIKDFVVPYDLNSYTLPFGNRTNFGITGNDFY